MLENNVQNVNENGLAFVNCQKAAETELAQKCRLFFYAQYVLGFHLLKRVTPVFN